MILKTIYYSSNYQATQPKEREKFEMKGGKKSSASSYLHFFIQLSFLSTFVILLFGLKERNEPNQSENKT